jgi:hypothetical protein
MIILIFVHVQADFKGAAASSQLCAVRVAQIERDLAARTQRVLELEEELRLLRDQLRKCDDQRIGFRSTLALLRGDFELCKGWITEDKGVTTDAEQTIRENHNQGD